MFELIVEYFIRLTFQTEVEQNFTERKKRKRKKKGKETQQQFSQNTATKYSSGETV